MSVIHVFLDADPAQAGEVAPVDINSALPGGDNNIGNVDLASPIPAGTNNIGDVDIASFPAGTQAGAAVKTADFDTGAGTDNVLMHGIAIPKSGGAVAGGTATDPIRTDPTGTTTQPVSSTQLPSSLGQKTKANSASIVFASDQDALSVIANSYELKSDVQSVTAAGASVQILGTRRFDITSMTNIAKNSPTTTAGHSSPNANLGGYTASTLNRILMGIPDQSPFAAYTLESAILHITNQDHSLTPNGLGLIQVFRVLPAASWAAESDVSWTYRSIASTQAWPGGPGLLIGTDYSNIVMGSDNYNYPPTPGVRYLNDFTLDTTEFNALRAANHGVLIKMQNESAVEGNFVRFDSDDATADLRPYLEVNYRPIGAGSVPISKLVEVIIQPEGDGVRIKNATSVTASTGFKLVANQFYRLKISLLQSPTVSLWIPSGVQVNYQFVGPI